MKSCTDAKCHADWRDVAFHAGKAHRKVAEQCETCHEPHAARVDASDCVGCHNGCEAARRAASARRSRSTRPRRCDRRRRASHLSGLIGRPGRARGQGAAPPKTTRPRAGALSRPLPATPSPTNAIADSPASPATISARRRGHSRSSRPAAARSAITSVPSGPTARPATSRTSSSPPRPVQVSGSRASARPSAPAPSSSPTPSTTACLYGLPRHAGDARARGLGRDLHRLP